MKRILFVIGLILTFILATSVSGSYWIYEESTMTEGCYGTCNDCIGDWNATYPCTNVYDDDWDTYGLSYGHTLGHDTWYEGNFANVNESLKSMLGTVYLQTKLDGNLMNISFHSTCVDNEDDILVGFYFDVDDKPENLSIECYDDDGGALRVMFNGDYDMLYDAGVWFEINCTANWSCSLYGDCNTSDQRPCIEAEDLNECGEEYAGDYSEFEPQECDYCTPSWSCSEYGECVDNVKECLNVSDVNNCYAQTGLGSDEFNGTLSNYNTVCGGYVPTYSTSDYTGMVTSGLGEAGTEIIALMGVIVTSVAVIFGIHRFRKWRIDLNK